MNTKFKITAAVLSAGLIITPLSGLVQNNQNVAKADNTVVKEQNKKKYINHINYIDSQIHLKNNQLVMNKDKIYKYLKQNWLEINVNDNYKSPEEYLSNIEVAITAMNEKVASGWYKFDKEKGMIQKYQSREWINGYERYEKWWGFQYYARGAAGEQLARDFEDAAEKRAWGAGALGTVGVFSGGIGIPLLVIFTGFTTTQFYSIETKVRRHISSYGTVKVSVYVSGSYYTVEPIQ